MSKTLNPILEIGDDQQNRIPKSSDYEAWCCSPKCAGLRYMIAPTKKVGMKKAVWCPDCGYALNWKKKDKKDLR